MANCKSCGAEIIWATTERGRQAPLSVASMERRFVLASIGEGNPVDGNPVYKQIATYQSHFADCPHANEHRRPKSPIEPEDVIS